MHTKGTERIWWRTPRTAKRRKPARGGTTSGSRHILRDPPWVIGCKQTRNKNAKTVHMFKKAYRTHRANMVRVILPKRSYMDHRRELFKYTQVSKTFRVSNINVLDIDIFPM